MTAPRVRKIEQLNDVGWFEYRQCAIHIERQTKHENWYIQVQHADGGYLYDGWWTDSIGKTMREAVVEACRGAGLHPTDGGDRG